jgi:hypothetical protein
VKAVAIYKEWVGECIICPQPPHTVGTFLHMSVALAWEKLKFTESIEVQALLASVSLPKLQNPRESCYHEFSHVLKNVYI